MEKDQPKPESRVRTGRISNLLLAIALLSSPKIIELARDRLVDDVIADTTQSRSLISDDYGVDVSFEIPLGDDSNPIYAQEASQSEKVRMTKILSEELAKYPPSLIDTIGLKKVVISKGNSDSPNTFMGFSNTDFADTNNGVLYVSSFAGLPDYLLSFAEDYRFRRTLHHEILHIADASDGENFDNANWVIIDGFDSSDYFDNGSSLAGIEHLIDHPADILNVILPRNGFGTLYGRSGPNEDQAITATMLMMQNSMIGREIYDRMQDPVLAVKLAKMKGMFLEWSDGQMDENYWEDLRNGRVNNDYWKK